MNYKTRILIFLNPQLFFFRFQNFLRVCVFKSNLPVHPNRDSLWYPERLLWENWQQIKRRGRHHEYNIHGKELGSILLRHRIKISGLSVHTIPDFTAHSKISTLKNGLKRYWFVCRIHGIRVDESRIRKETVADSKISGYVWTGPERNNSREYYHVTCIVRGSNVAQTRCLFLFYQFRICSNPLLSTPLLQSCAMLRWTEHL